MKLVDSRTKEKDISLTLQRASWENILGVIKMCVPVSLDEDEREMYFRRTGKHWTVGDFWDSVKELRDQLEDK